MRWPGHLPAGTVARTPGAHIDLLPTLTEVCGAGLPDGVRLDGQSLLGAWRGDGGMPERALVIQCHRGDQPIAERHAAIRKGRWKLVRPSGFAGEGPGKDVPWELYDLANDPFETNNLAKKRPEKLAALTQVYATQRASDAR